MRVQRTSKQCVVATYDSLTQAQMAFRLLDRQLPSLRKAIVSQPRQVRNRLAPWLPRKDQSVAALRWGALVGGGVGFLLGSILVGMLLVANFTGVAPYFTLMGLTIAGVVVGSFIGAMSGWEVPAPLLAQYQQQVREGEVLLVTSGQPGDLAGAQAMLESTNPEEIVLHATTSDDHAGESRKPFEGEAS